MADPLTLGAVVACVAVLMGEPVPVDNLGVITPTVRIESRAEFDRRPPPDGYIRSEWRGQGLFRPGPKDRPRRARIVIADRPERYMDITLAHEVAHFVLWINGREWRHWTAAGRATAATVKIAVVERKFRTWCRPGMTR